jgi:predicted HicB family RNase H-like nuclease
MKKKETLNFRVPGEFKRKLIEEANKQRRSLTNYLETTFMQVWDEQEKASAAQQDRKQKRSPK